MFQIASKYLLKPYSPFTRCFFSTANASMIRFSVYPQGFKGTHTVNLEVVEGTNLMDALIASKEIGSQLDEFGLCGKELSCQTCRVNFTKGYDKLLDPTVDEEDVFDQLGKDYKAGQTRMSCQIKVTKHMEGSEIEIPKEAFAE